MATGGFDVVDRRYEGLYERARAALNDDPRVTSVELAGSIAAGTADEWSDLDIHVVVRADDYDRFLAEWPVWLERITPTVFARTPIAPFISFMQRDEHLKYVAGVPHLLGLLTTVFLAETGAPPPAKNWNRTFTAEQRAAVAALPPFSATRRGCVDFGLGLARLLIERARPLYKRYDRTWPTELCAVTAVRLEAALGVDVAAWLY